MKIAEQVFTILSDDVRHEIGNKNSIMGIYLDRLVFQELPALLPKLTLTVFLIDLKVTKMPEAVVKVFTPKMEPVTLEVPASMEEKTANRAIMSIGFSPFKAEAPGEARIEICFGGEKEPTIIHKFAIEKAQKTKKGK